MPTGFAMSGLSQFENAKSAVAYNTAAYMQAKKDGLNVAPEQFGLGYKLSNKFGYGKVSDAMPKFLEKTYGPYDNISAYHTVPINNNVDYSDINRQRAWATAQGKEMPILKNVKGGPSGWTPPPPPPPPPPEPLSVPIDSPTGYTNETMGAGIMGPDPNYIPASDPDYAMAPGEVGPDPNYTPPTQQTPPPQPAITPDPTMDVTAEPNIESSFPSVREQGSGWNNRSTKLVGTSAIAMVIENLDIAISARDRLRFAFGLQEIANYELNAPPTTMTYSGELGRCLSRQSNGSGVYVDD